MDGLIKKKLNGKKEELNQKIKINKEKIIEHYLNLIHFKNLLQEMMIKLKKDQKKLYKNQKVLLLKQKMIKKEKKKKKNMLKKEKEMLKNKILKQNQKENIKKN